MLKDHANALTRSSEFRFTEHRQFAAGHFYLTLIGALNWLTRWWHAEGPISASTIADRVSDIFLAGLLVRRMTPGPPPG